MYDSRLVQIERLDALGFYAYHLAEHHTPAIHSLAPSQNVFLGSVAQRTRRMRFGPCVYVLPLHHPLRLIEEISMLDHLSDGRLEIGRVRQALSHTSQHAFFGVSALLFAASAALTIAWCESLSAMGEMPMPGGWTMSMTWMRMPGQTWPGAAASFLGMWVVTMAAMMLPSLVPPLWRYRQAVGTPES